MSTTAPRAMSAHNNLHALLFQATSAEYTALCIQTYQLARHALRDRLAQKTFRKCAVVFDLDETVLDNSAYQAWQIQTGSNFDEKTSWRDWCNAAQAEAVPGAVEFVRFVEQAEVTPIFITSREDVTRPKTLENLQALGVLTANDKAMEEALIGKPDAALKTRLFMKRMTDITVPRPSGPRTWPLANKFLQRAFLQQVRDFEVILSVGDNLGDYAEYYGRVYDPKTNDFYSKDGKLLTGKHPAVAERRESAAQDAPLFGRDFILIPNATYGGWVRAFEANKLGSSDELAGTGVPVRETLKEPQTPFTYANPDPTKPEITVAPVGPKFAPSEALRIWDGK
jgi:predicted secreted acid phosphatase